MSKKSKRLRTEAARTLRAARPHRGKVRKLLDDIAASYKKRALKEELKRGEQPRSKKRTLKKKIGRA